VLLNLYNIRCYVNKINAFLVVSVVKKHVCKLFIFLNDRFFYSIQADGMLAEGSPIAPEPMVVSWRPDYVVGTFLYIVPKNLHFSHFYFLFFQWDQEGARIEAAFRYR
jgi:hypothetical protein